MKNVRLFLSAFAVLAIVGSALAFKAKPYNTVFCVKLHSGGTGVCTGQLTGRQINGAANYYGFVKQPNDICTQLQCTVALRIDGQPD